jgi:hypothetical protein
MRNLRAKPLYLVTGLLFKLCQLSISGRGGGGLFKPKCSRYYSVRALSLQWKLTNGARALEVPMANISGLASMLLGPQKASLAVLWRTEWYFGISMLEGLSATLF